VTPGRAGNRRKPVLDPGHRAEPATLGGRCGARGHGRPRPAALALAMSFAAHSPQPGRPVARRVVARAADLPVSGARLAHRHCQRCCGPLPNKPQPRRLHWADLGFRVAGPGFEPGLIYIDGFTSLKERAGVKCRLCPFLLAFPAGFGHAGRRAGVQVERPAGRTTWRPVLLPAHAEKAGNRYAGCGGACPVCSRVRGRRAAAFIPSGCPRLVAAGAWGGSRAGGGINQRRGRAARGRGPDLRAITRCPGPGLLTPPAPGGCGRPGT
jgi:hypothetical protein